MSNVTATEHATPEIVYHVFTHHTDIWTADYRLARAIYKHWKQSQGSARLYEEWYEDRDDDPIEECCLLSYGPYPL